MKQTVAPWRLENGLSIGLKTQRLGNGLSIGLKAQRLGNGLNIGLKTQRLGNGPNIGLKTQKNQESQRVFRWPFARPSGCRLHASVQPGTQTFVCVCVCVCVFAVALFVLCITRFIQSDNSSNVTNNSTSTAVV